MKVSAFLMFVGAFCLMAETAVSQNIPVCINRTNVSLETVLNDIEAQTEQGGSDFHFRIGTFRKLRSLSVSINLFDLIFVLRRKLLR